MLLKFRVANHRSIRDEQELSFIATELNESTAIEVETKPSGGVRVLPVIGLYGPNASGKSNVLDALADLGSLGRGYSDWDPHVLDPATREAPTRYEIELLIDSVRYIYGLEFTEVVLTEWLYAYPNGRRQVWFERDAAASEPIRFPDNHLGPTQSTLAELVRPDRPFIGLANEVRHAKLEPVGQWFSRLREFGMPGRQSGGNALVNLLGGKFGDRVIDMLQRADQGIEGAEVVEVEWPDGDTARNITRRRREVRLRHRGRSADAEPFALQLESEGTRAWLRMLVPLLPTLADGGVLVVDELDGSLHPELAAEMIRMFYDPRLNRHNAQLLFSSHDASLLSPVFGRPLLDRDQLWFTEKDAEGATELYPLADLKPRKGENIERGYLSGRYGAVPGLSPGELARALWPEDEDGPE